MSDYPKGLSVEVSLNVTSFESFTPSSSQVMDSRLDLRILRQGPTIAFFFIPSDKLALHDAKLHAFVVCIRPL
ncbi:conjugal transfer protein TraN, partial [Salmonella enterica subsp. enterica serovar Infantis]